MIGIVKVDNPFKVNKIQWALENLNCNEISKEIDDDINSMEVYYYSTGRAYNADLRRLYQKNNLGNYGLFFFIGLDETEVNSID